MQGVVARKGAAGVDGQSVGAFASRKGEELAIIERLLRENRYEPSAVKRCWIPKPGTGEERPLGVPTVGDRVVQTALAHVRDRAGFEMNRYADYFVIQCRSEAEARRALAMVGAWVKEAGLELHAEKTRVVDARERGGFEFLGWYFERGHRWPREKSQQRFREAVREQTRRTDGRSMETIIQAVNRRVQGWGGYFRAG